MTVGDGHGAGEGTHPGRRPARRPRRRGAAGGVVRAVAEPELPRHAHLVGVGGDDDRRGGAGVRQPVAVVVDPVEGDLGHAGVDVDVAVVAVVAAALHRVVPVAVHVVVDGGGLEHAVAVLVDLVVEDLGGAGVDGRVAVVAVGAVGHVALGGCAVERRRLGVAVGVDVDVPVPHRHQPGAGVAVDVAVAVVVHRVAGLDGAGEDAAVHVVAVVAQEAVVAPQVRAAARRLAGAVPVEVVVPVVAGDFELVVDLAVAVVVDAVAHLGVAGVAHGAGLDRVVAVVADGDVALLQAAHHRRLAGAVPVAVHVAEDRDVAGGDHRVGVVAVEGGDLGGGGDAVPAVARVPRREAETGRGAAVERVEGADRVGHVLVHVRAVGLAHVGAGRVDALLDGRPGGDGLRGGDGVAGLVLHDEGVRVGVDVAGAEEQRPEEGAEHHERSEH